MIERLRVRIKELESECRFAGKPYPKGIEPFPRSLTGQGFFPGGDGLWRDNTPTALREPAWCEFPTRGIMFLGNDFGTTDGFSKLKLHENPPTWRNLRRRLALAGIDGNLGFFTNAYLGLRSDRSALDGGLLNKDYDQLCISFLRFQIECQKPKLIVVLGDRPSSLLKQSLGVSGLSLGLPIKLESSAESAVILQVTHPHSDLSKRPPDLQKEASILSNAWGIARG